MAAIIPKVAAGFLLLAVLPPTPQAEASPTCTNPYTCNTNPNPVWNGQLQPTWEVPYGGFTSGPTQCDVFTLQCRGVVGNPNG